jgi:hypothetical protein
MLARTALSLFCCVVQAVAVKGSELGQSNVGLEAREIAGNEPTRKPNQQWETLRIVVGHANIAIERSEDDRFQVSAEIDSPDTEPRAGKSFETTGPIKRTLDKAGRMMVIEDLHRDDPKPEKRSVEIHLKVPGDVWCEVEMRSGEVLVHSGIKGITSRAADGRLKFTGNVVGRIGCEASSRRVDVNLKAATRKGNITLDVQEEPAAGNIALATDGGRIEVRTPSKSLRLLEVASPTAGYAVDLPGNRVRGKGRINSGGAGRISLRLSAKSGAISVVGN